MMEEDCVHGRHRDRNDNETDSEEDEGYVHDIEADNDVSKDQDARTDLEGKARSDTTEEGTKTPRKVTRQGIAPT